jgi:DNA-binding protein WhiA
MSLSDEVRSELAAINPRRSCCRLAELSGLLRTAGSVHLRGAGRIALHLEVASPAVARRAFALLRSYGVSCEIRTFRRRAFDEASRYQLHLEDDARALQVLHEAGILDANLAPLERPPRRVVARPCCHAAYLRGAFLAAGSATGPRHAHLELRASNLDAAELLAELARAEGFPAGVYARAGHAVTYVKGIETVAELLAFLGAQEASLRLGESAVVAATKARANRLANADHANIARASRAAEAQIRAIRRLEEQGRLEGLSPQLREIARLRARHPTLSLRELAARCRPTATKASAQRRLAKLQRLAEGYERVGGEAPRTTSPSG